MSTIEKATGWVVELRTGTLVGPFESANEAAEYVESASTRIKGSQENSAKIRPLWNPDYEYYDVDTIQFDVERDGEDEEDDEVISRDFLAKSRQQTLRNDDPPCHCDGCEERKRRKSECDCVA